MRILISSFLLATCFLYGQPGKVGAPSSGFVLDQSAHVLRRIQGIPGASLVGDPVDFGFAVSAAYVAPRLDSAFVVAADGQAHLFRLTADAPAERTVESMATPSLVVFSPSGSSAALYSPGSVQVVKGLPDSPVAGASIRLRVNPRLKKAAPDTLSISDDGGYVLYASGGPIELIGVAGDSRRVIGSGAGTLAAFAAGGHDAAALNGDKLILYQDIAGAATERSFAGVADPSAIAFSPDSQRLFVASATGKKVTAVQVSTGDRSDLACACTPAALIPMGPLFRLNELGSEPLWLVDTTSDRGLVFVPMPTGN